MKKIFFPILFILSFCLVFIACMDKAPQEPGKFNISKSDGCVSCHANSELLKQVATPLPPPSGESGEG